MEYFVYVLISEKDGKFYIGISRDPRERLKAHNRGETKSTKGRRPFKLTYTEKIGDRSKARIREKYLKSGIGREFLKTIIPR